MKNNIYKIGKSFFNINKIWQISELGQKMYGDYEVYINCKQLRIGENHIDVYKRLLADFVGYDEYPESEEK